MGLGGVPSEALGAIFDSFNADGGKFIEYDELHEMIKRSHKEYPKLPPLPLTAKNPIALRRKKIKKEDANLLQSLDIDEEHLDLVAGQIKAALKRESVRVLDLFRQFDDDASGSISRAEFRKAMCELGLKASKAAVKELFKEFDADGYGSVEYDELKEMLRHADALITDAQAVALGEREEERLRPHTSLDGRSAKIDLDAPPPTAPARRGSKTRINLTPSPAPPPEPPKPPSPPPLPPPHYFEPLRFEAVQIAEGCEGYLFVHGRDAGRLRGAERLALVMHALPALKPNSKKGKAAGGLHTRVCALPLYRLLADAGWSILHVPPHALGALAGQATIEADSKLRAALAFVGSDRSLRYCKIALLAQGPAATAALVAMSVDPALLEYRVRALSVCQPAPLRLTNPIAMGVSLDQHAYNASMPTLLSYASGSPANEKLALEVDAALASAGEQTPAIAVDTGDSYELFGAAQRFDGAKYFGEHPEALLEFLRAHVKRPERPTGEALEELLEEEEGEGEGEEEPPEEVASSPRSNRSPTPR